MKLTKSELAVLKDAVISLEMLVVRFPLDGYAINGKCKCIQFEDNDECRHTLAVENLAEAKIILELP